MKVSQPGNKSTGNGSVRSGLSGHIWQLVIVLMVLAIIAPVVLLMLRPGIVQNSMARLEARWGYAFAEADQGLYDKWSIAFGNYLRDAQEVMDAVPELVIDVPFKEMTRIYEKRNAALERGILVQGDNDFVKGDIRVDGRVVPIKLRLKGDWNDHLMGRKWSFRIRTRGDEQLFGMRRFSIQSPVTRGYQSELLFFSALQMYDVMVPRYQFVNVTLNGDSMGLMALEEFFAKELLEYNRRRESVIIRFDESLAWDARDALSGEPNGWGGAFDNYSNAPIDGIGSSRIAESPILSQQYAVAAGLLNGFVEQTLLPSQVFDVDRMAAFIAVSDMLGAWHATRWHNLRFYLNPVTMRLEPIPFDATLQEGFRDDRSVIIEEPLLAQLLAEPVMWEAYTRVLRELEARLAEGSLQSALEEVQQQHLDVLQTEFRMLGRFPLDYLQPRVEALLARADAVAPEQGNNPNLVFLNSAEMDEYPVLAHMGLRSSADGLILQLDNAIPRDVEIRSADWVSQTDESMISAVDMGDLPVVLPARGIGSPGRRTTVDLLAAPAETGWQVVVEAGLVGRAWSKAFYPQPVHAALAATPVPEGDLAEQLRLHRFLQLDQDSKQINVVAGIWDVAAPVVIPPGYTLRAGSGTTLNFGPDAYLLVHGAVTLAGSESGPLVLQASGDSWPGMIVMNAAAPSLVEYVVVRDTHGVGAGDWGLTGGFSFYASDVLLRNSQLFDSHGEDALNIIHSDFTIEGIRIEGTASDAFDADFSTGSVVGSVFQAVGKAGGGDAVDISGSDLVVTDCEFLDISDKALSVGERSRMKAERVTIKVAGTGAASKDASSLILSDSRITEASFAGLTAYVKKQEYGPAEVVASNVDIRKTERPLLAQTDSRVVVDDKAAATEDVDVDALYDTVMRKGLKR